MSSPSKLAISLVLLIAPISLHAAPPAEPAVERIAPDRVRVTWNGAGGKDSGGVDVLLAARSDAAPADMRLVSGNDRDGRHEEQIDAGTRPYFVLRDRASGEKVMVAERVLPLRHGSNFRDIGGYPAAGDKHVRWGLIFRSGATPLLSPEDIKTIGTLNLAGMVDLRSTEERQLAPSRISQVPYHAYNYSMAAFMRGHLDPNERPGDEQPMMHNGGGLYRHMPEMLAPHLRIVFRELLARQGAVAYNCSAGQDRTGFVTAMILTALGTPRDTIIADYHLSTNYRQPENEMPAFDPAAFPDNAAAEMFSRYRKGSGATKPQPLKEDDGKAFLSFAFDEIEARYGSVEAYLQQKVGIDAQQIETLRSYYLT